MRLRKQGYYPTKEFPDGLNAQGTFHLYYFGYDRFCFANKQNISETLFKFKYIRDSFGGKRELTVP